MPSWLPIPLPKGMGLPKSQSCFPGTTFRCSRHKISSLPFGCLQEGVGRMAQGTPSVISWIVDGQWDYLYCCGFETWSSPLSPSWMQPLWVQGQWPAHSWSQLLMERRQTPRAHSSKQNHAESPDLCQDPLLTRANRTVQDWWEASRWVLHHAMEVWEGTSMGCHVSRYICPFASVQGSQRRWCSGLAGRAAEAHPAHNPWIKPSLCAICSRDIEYAWSSSTGLHAAPSPDYRRTSQQRVSPATHFQHSPERECISSVGDCRDQPLPKLSFLGLPAFMFMHGHSDRVCVHLPQPPQLHQSPYPVPVEKESNQSLPFLDVLLNHHPDGTVFTSVFRKPTHMDKYLDFTSHHPLTYKVSVIRTLYRRAKALSSNYSAQMKRSMWTKH